ncbi:MAG: hypothetical protein LBH65_06385, partial [Desulfovibrio sp.]|nr:hypothetical protein [Desulfovibrio sp.]
MAAAEQAFQKYNARQYNARHEGARKKRALVTPYAYSKAGPGSNKKRTGAASGAESTRDQDCLTTAIFIMSLFAALHSPTVKGNASGGPPPRLKSGMAGRIFHRNFLYGLKPLPSGRCQLDARQRREYLSGNPFLQGGGN